MKQFCKIFSILFAISISVQTAIAAEKIDSFFSPLKTSRSNIQSVDGSGLKAMMHSPAEVRSVQYVNVNLTKLKSSTKSISLQLAPDLAVLAERTHASHNKQGDLVWQGRINQWDGEVSQVRFGRHLSGTVRLGDRQFEISALNNNFKHEIVEVNLKNAFPDHEPDYNEALLITEESNKAFKNAERASSLQAAAAAPVVIRLIVAYTTDTPSTVTSKIQQAISETNAGYSASGINATVQLAHAYKTNYAGSGDHGTDLTRFHKKGDGYMEEIFALRDTHKADVAILIINTASACGRAQAIGANESNAYAVVKLSCATGNYSFGHEIGHLLSARHNPETDSSNSPYAYGHGYCYPSGGWRSIMSYDVSCASRKNFWFDPTRLYNGVPTGTTTRSDNARVLRITTPVIANFRK